MDGDEPKTHPRRRAGPEVTHAATLPQRLREDRSAEHYDESRAGQPLAVGPLIDGRYRILETLGEGGMGAVYRVEHVRMGKIMALKILHRDLAQDASFVERFAQEAKIVSRLSHPNTVSVFDFGELADHGLYMAMEYVPGKDLHELVEAGGPFAEPRAIGIAIQILNSLAEAHDAGIVHRDIKPANVMLVRTRDDDDFVKVVDFGIAKVATLKKGERRITDAGSRHLIGTPEYVSPEQARGEALDARSDLYSLASLLFELVSGEPLFEGATAMAIVGKHLTDPPPKISEVAPNVTVSAEFEAILQTALAKDPADRYQSADQMRQALTTLADGLSGKVVLPAPARPPITVDESIAQRADWDRFERELQRSRRVRGALTGALIVALVGGIGAALVAGVRNARRAPAVLAVTEEREPNNQLEHANRIAGLPIRGTIGPRLSDSESDIDYFVFDVPPQAAPQSVRVMVTAVPNVNIAVALLGASPDGKWRVLAKADDQPLDATLPEVIDDVPVAPGLYAVSVREQVRASETHVRRPRENSTDRYTLSVTVAPSGPLDEREPDNSVDEASLNVVSSQEHAVVGHSGGFAPREVSHGVAATLWSDDHFVLSTSPDAQKACVLLVGTANAKLELQLIRSDAPMRAPVGVTSQQIGAQCTTLAPGIKLVARVSVASGAEYDAPYVLALVDDGKNGTGGLQQATAWLTAHGRADDARELTRRAFAEVVRAKR